MSVSYRTLRDVHLAAALAAAAFLAAYAASAVQMTFFNGRPDPVRSTAEVEVPDAVGSEPRALARWLMTEADVRGLLVEIDERGGAIRLRVERPGTAHRVVFDRASRRAQIATQRWNALWTLNRLHHAAGFAPGFPPLAAWGGAVLLASSALLVLAATGLTMWFQRHRERRSGAIVFAVGLAWGLGLLIWIRLH